MTEYIKKMRRWMMNEPGVNYLPDVEFRGHISDTDNCVCSGCHKMGVVLKLTVPETGYHDGKRLSTKYHEYWICDDCIEKLARCYGAVAKEAGGKKESTI